MSYSPVFNFDGAQGAIVSANAFITLKKQGSVTVVTDFAAFPKREGHGKRLLTRLTWIADRDQLRLGIDAPAHIQPMLHSMGFRMIDGLLVRQPAARVKTINEYLEVAA